MTRRCSPSEVRTSRALTVSAVRPPTSECTPQELLPDHASERAPRMRRGIRPEHQLMRGDCPLEIVEHDTRLHACRSTISINLENRVQVTRHIDHDSRVAALTRQARSGAARQNRRLMDATDPYGLDDIVNGPRMNDRDWDLAVVGSVGGVQSPGAGVKSDFACDACAQRSLEGLKRGRRE